MTDADIFADHLQMMHAKGIAMRPVALIPLLFLLGFAHDASAFHLEVNGLVTDHGTTRSMAAARIRLYKNGVVQKLLWTNAAGKYSITLDNHADYVLRVDAPGYQAKCITIDTHGAEWQGDGRLRRLEVEMRLVRKQPGTDLSCFDLPLGLARFEPATGLTRWNLAYENKVNAEVQATMSDYELRCLMGSRPTSKSTAGPGAYIRSIAL